MLSTFRRDLHQIPELGLDTEKTMCYIKERLAPLQCKIYSPIPNSVVAYFDRGQEETIAFRSDMDALPMMEQNTFSFRSENGKMHACGHDGHMSMLLGLAYRINEQKELPYNVLLIFQPGEEDPGGAELLIKAGLFDPYRIKALFGFHIYPNLPAGKIVTRPGVMMAGACNLQIEIKGVSSHAAMPEKGKDALLAGADLISRSKQKEAVLFDEGTFHLLHFGTFESGNAFNIVSDHALIQGTIRYFEPFVFDQIMDVIKDEIEAAAQTYGVSINWRIDQHYPPLVNDRDLIDRIMKEEKEIGLLEKPVLIAEDFAFYAKAVPAAFFFIGSGKPFPLHSSLFDFDEQLLPCGVSFYEKVLDMFSRKP